MISLKQLHYALAVERTLHFKKAAESVSVSQSALSTALSEMEKQLGFQIFERDNKKVLVTPLGQQVLDKAKSIMMEVDDIHRLADANKEPLSSPLSLGIIPTIGPFLLPLILPPLQQAYPKLELNVTEEQSHVLVDQVRRGELDTAILALPYDIQGLLSFKFWQENFYWVTNRDDKLADQPSIHSDDIDSSELMLLKEGHCLKDHALAACRLSNLSPKSLSATSLATLVQLVAGKMGSTLVPEIALESLVDLNPALKKAPLDEKGPHREFAFIVRPNYPSIKNIELMMELFSKTLKKRFD